MTTNISSCEKGKLYQFNGVELVEIEPNDGKKLPVTDEAFEFVKTVRSESQKLLGFRPDLLLVASALLLRTTNIEGNAEAVKEYAINAYTGTASSKQ